MDATQLKDRITKKEQQIEKINRRIKKWGDQCSEEEREIAQKYATDYKGYRAYCTEHNIGYSFTPIDELRHAYGDLDEAIVTLNKYKNQLKLVEERDNTEKIGVIVDFLQRYKEMVIEYVERDIDNVTEYYRIEHESCDFYNNRWYLIREGEMSEEEWKRRYRQMREEAQDYHDVANPLTFEVYDRRADDKINHDRLNEILDKDIEAKYWTMVNKVTKITGEIIDATQLRIAGDGNLNGIIIGVDGKAKLETILAGGYNQNIIVNVKHGQILHYRLLVNPIR